MDGTSAVSDFPQYTCSPHGHNDDILIGYANSCLNHKPLLTK